MDNSCNFFCKKKIENSSKRNFVILKMQLALSVRNVWKKQFSSFMRKALRFLKMRDVWAVFHRKQLSFENLTDII